MMVWQLGGGVVVTNLTHKLNRRVSGLDEATWVRRVTLR
jgi:hypothetical protein